MKMIPKALYILLTVALLLSCSSTEKSQPKTNFSELLIAKIDGFTRIGQVKIYPVDSLTNYIATVDEYTSYGVVQVAAAEYSKNGFAYSIDIFEFDSPLGAFGIYARKRQPTDTFIGLGAESFIGSGYLYYFKDRYFMTVNSYGDDIPDMAGLNRLAEVVDSLIPGTEAYPEQIMIFPKNGLIEHSQKFWPRGLANYAVPESCFSADYESEGKTCRLFYALDRPITEYETFVKLIQQKGRILIQMAGVGENSVYAVSELDGQILLGYSDKVIFGVLNVADDSWAKDLCREIMANMGKEL